jgi:hypothetical protein
MTVCTNDLALCHLVEDALPLTVPEAGGNAELLVTKMVELKDDGIGLATIDAWMFPQVCDQEVDAFGDDNLLPSPGRLDVPLAIRRIVRLLVLRTTWAAIVVPLPQFFAAPSEVVDRFSRLQRPHLLITPGYIYEQTFPGPNPQSRPNRPSIRQNAK